MVYSLLLARFFVSIAALSLFVMRPSHLGEAYNSIGIAIFFLSSMMAMVFSRNIADRVQKAWLPVLAFVLFWVYVFFHAQILGVSSVFVFYTVLLSLFIGAACLIIFSSYELTKQFTTFFVTLVGCLGFSSLLTFLIGFILPMSELVYGKLSIPTYPTGDLLVPLSLGYNQISTPWGVVYRLGGFWREVGIAQAIFCWALVVVLSSKGLRFRKLLIMGCIGGAIATQSTLAYSNLALVLALYLLFISKVRFIHKFLLVLILSPVFLSLVWFSVTDESVGLAAKIDGVSFSDRMIAIQYALSFLSENPWGYGMYGNSGVIRTNAGINLIASSGALGVVGVLLYLISMAAAVYDRENMMPKLVAFLPIFLTSLTSQPLIDSLGVAVILMMPVCLMGVEARKPTTVLGASAARLRTAEKSSKAYERLETRRIR